MNPKIFPLIVAGALASVVPGVSAAHGGYLLDSSGNPVRSAYGQCWRTGGWTPAMATADCDPDLMPKAAPAQPTSHPTPAEPNPTPVASPVVAGPDKPAFEKVVLTVETLFDFDRSALREAGKPALDGVVENLRAHPEVEVAMVTGHADRLGPEAYNQGLSLRRAEAVKAYLVARGIAAERIHAEGRGESEPSMAAGECKGERRTRALLACLQPDRRVVVEIAVQRPLGR